MTTILKEVQIEGHGLMKNKPCTVKLFPSNSGKIRYFVNGEEPFEANVDNVLSTDHCVVLGNKKAKAMLTEHLTAALAFCGIDSIDICMDEMEVPALDGSSKKWVDLFKSAGIEKHLFEKKKYYTVREPVYYLNGKTSLVILPADELFISYAVNYGIKMSSAQYAVLFNNDAFAQPDWLSQLVRVADSDESIFSVGSLMIQHYNRDLADDAGDYVPLFGWTCKRGDGLSKDRYQKQERIFSACGGAALYRKSILDEIGLFDENFFAYGEDVDIGWRANNLGYKNIFNPKAVCYHICSATNSA